MSFERTLEGTVAFIDRQNRTLRVILPALKGGASQGKFPKPQLPRFGFVPALKGGVCKGARITQKVKKDGNVQSLSPTFALALNVTVTSGSGGILKLTELKIRQRVLVHYVTESGGKYVANTIALVEPTSKPTSFAGVQVAAS